MRKSKLLNFMLPTLIISLIPISLPAETVVAIFDSGVDPIHMDLQNKLIKNKNESLNQRDDDHNMAIDDLYGWNLIDENNKEIFKSNLFLNLDE